MVTSHVRSSRGRALAGALSVLAATTVLTLAPAVAGSTAFAATLDSCGYPSGTVPALSATVFNENTLTRAVQVYGTGISAKVAVFSNDESGILLGQQTSGGTAPTAFTPTSGQTYGTAHNPSLGDLTAVDASSRPLPPTLYITDITAGPSTAGDWQSGGPHPTSFINDVFGTWDTATSPPYTITKPAAQNHWALGPGSDAPTGGFSALGTDEGFGTEFRWDVSDPRLQDDAGNALQANHTYRVQVMSHDGDQNKVGGDVGELCTTITIPPTNVTTQVRNAANDQDITGATVAVGTDVYDSVVVHGTVGGSTPTGNVTFNWFNDGTCTTSVGNQTLALVNGIADTKTTPGPRTGLGAGDYSFQASYGGDSHYLSAVGDCETFSLAKLTSNVDTAVEDPGGANVTGGTVVVGTAVHDVATVSGDGVRTPTGTVDFAYFTDGACTSLAATDAGETVTAGFGHTGVATSATHTPAAAGAYSFRATYAGDSTYRPATGGCEVFDAATPQLPALSMTKSSNPVSGSVVQPGARIDYTITITNSGFAAAPQTVVTDTLPDHVTVVSGSAQPAFTTSGGNTISWTVTVPAATTSGGAFVPGRTVITYAVTVDRNAPEGTTLTNVALIGGQCVGNADASACTTNHHVPTGDLTLVKHVDKTTANYGDTLTYTFDASTTGALDQTGVVVTDVVPNGTTYVSGSADCTDAGTCTASFNSSTRTVTWQLGAMAASATRHLVFKVTIDRSTFDPSVGLPPKTILNSGVIASNETASTPSNVVKTTVVAVLGVKAVRTPNLPFTGVPAQQLGLLGLLLLAAGIVLTTGRRRRDV